MRVASTELCKRLRIVAGQSVIKPPAIDIEAADHIEQLEKELAQVRRSKLKAIGEVVIHGVVGVSFYESCDYGCGLPAGTVLYTSPLK